MIKTALKFANSEYEDEQLNESISDILDSNTLMSVATIVENRSWIHTAYYCFNSTLELFMLTDPNAQHSKNVEKNSSVAIAISDSRQSWDENKKGLQIFGKCEKARGAKIAEALKLYVLRFAGLKEFVRHPDDFLRGAIHTRFYVIKPKSLKLFDETRFGEENFISLEIEEQR